MNLVAIQAERRVRPYQSHNENCGIEHDIYPASYRKLEWLLTESLRQAGLGLNIAVSVNQISIRL